MKASTRHFGKKDKTMGMSVFSVILIEIYLEKIYIYVLLPPKIYGYGYGYGHNHSGVKHEDNTQYAFTEKKN
jgi:hypothetical protein